jgi:lipoate-protein ligase A
MLITLPNAFGDATTNLAINAALLKTMPEGLAAFRHYAWLEPTFTFGKTQSYSEAKAASPEGATLCRRLTNGGLLDHRNDWSFAFVSHNSLPCTALLEKTQNVKIHLAIQHALSALNTNTQLIKTEKEEHLINSEGKQIAVVTAAHSEQDYLIEGSIDRGTLPDSFDFASFEKNLLTQISSTLNIAQGKLEDIRPLFKSEYIESEKLRFSGNDWNQQC